MLTTAVVMLLQLLFIHEKTMHIIIKHFI